MKDTYWSVFKETGEPMCFLLLKAEEKCRSRDKTR